jgi:hypothetical protein
VKSTRKFLAAMTVALVAAASLSLAASAQACPYTGAEQVFQPWGDASSYVLAPDGGFENGAQGWALSRGAGTVEGNESFYLGDPADSHALALPAGSSAVSPSICMSIDTPSFRMFARNTGDPSSELRVEAVYSLLGLVRTKAVSNLKADPAWAPSKKMSTVLTLSTITGTLIPSAIQIRITPVGSGGQWTVDDLYVDPFARR